jgi:acetoin:2,6-dichlorophenolindophenol oxidoreductase subunit beta
MVHMTYRQASNVALAEEMRRDERVWAVGEDLGRGGLFDQYCGLMEEFGADRIIDAPISEAAILGAAVGAALAGARPIVEMRISDFALCAMDELVNQAAKARFMFGGQARVPIVVREPIGISPASAAQHSQSLEAWYVHVPGLVVVTPATPADARGLLKASVRCDDPVVLMEHKALWAMEGDVDVEDDGVFELGKAAVLRDGTHITLVSWSAQVHVCLEAAALMSAHGIQAEVVDLRTLWPWDKKAVAASIAKTGRLLVVHEAVRVGGFGAEIAAWIAENCSEDLRSPVARLGAPRLPAGYAPTLESELRVTATAIADRAIRLIEAR